MPAKTILFDINETVLDLAAIKAPFDDLFGDRISLAHWFSTLLHASNVAAITGLETDFKALATATLTRLANETTDAGIQPDPEKVEAITTAFGSMRPHEDVVPALQLLKRHDFTTIAFSNSSLALIDAQISNAGLEPFFDQIISVEEAGSFKPVAKVYQHAAEKLGVNINELWLVAVHDWDTHGAISAGLSAAWLKRGNADYLSLYHQPNITAGSMIDIAEQLIRSYGEEV